MGGGVSAAYTWGNAGLLDARPPELGRRAAVWKRPLFIILAVLTVLVVVGAAYWFSSDGTSGLVAPVIAMEISRRTHADTA